MKEPRSVPSRKTSVRTGIPGPAIVVILLMISLSARTVSANVAPIADAGDDREVKVGEVVLFGASDSYDPDGSSLSYSWDFDASDGIQPESILIAPSHVYEVPGEYQVTLEVSDGEKNDTDNITVRVNPDLPPTVVLGEDREVGLNEWFFVDARNSSDPNNDHLSFSWDFDASDGLQEESSDMLVRWRYDQEGNYTVTVTVTDGTHEVNDTVNITVRSGLFMVAQKKYSRSGTLEAGQRDSYFLSIVKGKGLEVDIASEGGGILNIYLFQEKHYVNYIETGEIVAMEAGTKQNATGLTYSIEITESDNYYVVIENPATEDGQGVGYGIEIRTLSSDEYGGMPWPGTAAVLSCFILVTVLLATVRRREAGRE